LAAFSGGANYFLQEESSKESAFLAFLKEKLILMVLKLEY
jgi:hypothetical protein